MSVYAEAKGEYTKQLCQYLVPALHKYFLDMLDDAKQKEPEAKKLLLTFQGLLEGISEWNMDKVQRETGVVITSSQCDYLEELLAAVFIAHTKVLSAIRLTTKQKKLQITIPKLDHFLHRTMTECARILWSNTYLFSPSAPSIERQRNLRQIEALLQDGVLQSIRGMLPVKNILREYLHEEEEDEEAEEEEAEAEEAVAAAAAVPAAATEQVTAPSAEQSPSPAPSTEVATEAAAAAPTIIVDTSTPIRPSAPPTPLLPPFSGNDTAALPPLEELEPEPEAEEHSEEGGDEEDVKEEIEMVDAPPEPMDDFEDLERAVAEPPAAAAPESDELPMDFEELS